MCCSIAKYLLFAFNFVFWAAGCALLGVGIWLTVDSSIQETISVLGETIAISTGAIVLIVAGAVMFLFGFVGCCGAIKESTCLLGTYAVLLIVVFGLELGIGIWVLVEYNSVDEVITDAYSTLAEEDPLSGPDESFEDTQFNFQCCGYNRGCLDWVGRAYGCGCTEGDKNCISTDQSPALCTFEDGVNFYYNQTCSEAMTTFIENNMTILGWVAVGIALVEIFGIILSIGFCCHVKNENKGHMA